MNALSRLLDASGVPDWRVAQACGIHPTLLSLYKTGRRTPHAENVAKLAQWFDVPESAITGDPAELPSDRTVLVTEVPGPRPLLPPDLDDPDEWIQ